MGAFLRFLCLPGLEFCQSSNFRGLVVSFLGCSLNCGEGFKYCTKTLGLLISTKVSVFKAKLVYKRATNANSDH